MFPRQGIPSFFFKIAGEAIFFEALQRNVLSHLSKVRKGRAHTFLSNNGQTSEGISHNTGAERCYTWSNTLVDCRQMPDLSAEGIDAFRLRLEKSTGFDLFCKDLEQRSGGFLKTSIFVQKVQGNNKRYNIRLETKSKYQEFDTLRVGILLKAESAEGFKMGLYHLLDWEKHNHADYRGMLILPTKTPA